MGDDRYLTYLDYILVFHVFMLNDNMGGHFVN
jgi:hypothetical protein